MKKNARYFCFLIILLNFSSLLSAGGSREDALRVRDVTGVTRVRLVDSGTLHIRQGNRDSLEIDARGRALLSVNVKIDGSELTIRRKPVFPGFFQGRVNYYLTLRNLESALTTGSGDIDIGIIDSRKLILGADSSGDIRMEKFKGEFLDVRLTSSGDLTVDSGRVTSQRISCSSSGDYRAPELSSETAEITLSSSGNAEIYTTERLTARLSSSGDLRLTGSPVIDALTLNSSGRLRRD